MAAGAGPRAEEARGAPGARRRRRRPRRAAATSAPRPARPRSRPPARTAPRRPRRRAARSCPAPRRSPRASSWCRPRCQVRARCTPHPTLAPGASPARTCLLSGAEPGARRARAQPLTLPEPGGCAAARAPGPESSPASRQSSSRSRQRTKPCLCKGCGITHHTAGMQHAQRTAGLRARSHAQAECSQGGRAAALAAGLPSSHQADASSADAPRGPVRGRAGGTTFLVQAHKGDGALPDGITLPAAAPAAPAAAAPAAAEPAAQARLPPVCGRTTLQCFVVSAGAAIRRSSCAQ